MVNKIKKFENKFSFLNYYLVVFLTMCFVGWIIEFIYSLVVRKIVVNPGFLYGPYLPMYGFGSLLLTVITSKCKNNKLLVFILSLLVCSIFEYFCSFLLEYIFKEEFWDYSNYFLNINGRICLIISFSWGLLGIFFVNMLEPLLYKVFDKVNKTGIIFIYYLIFIVFLNDVIISIIKYLI